MSDSVTSIGDGAFDDYNFPYKLKQKLISRFGRKILGNFLDYSLIITTEKRY